MARAKKKKLSLDELLDQALVKDEDKPYEVPENWVWTRLSQILDVRDGTHDTPKYVNEGIPLITSKNLRNGSLDFSKVKYISLEDHKKISERSGVSNEDILLAMIGTVGNPVIVEKTQEFSIKNVALLKKIPQVDISSKYTYFYLQYAQERMKHHASGGLQPFVSLTFLRKYEIPFPPIAEQQRIVDIIESLFEKLDTAKELAQNALDSFENRKAAVLHKAFTGELTAKWREENGVTLDEWEEKELKEICEKITDGTHKSPKNYDSGDYMYVTAKNIKEYGVELNNITYISKKDHKEIYSRCNVEYGDVLYIKDGATTGVATINTINNEFSLLSSVALLKPNKNKLDSKYLVYNLNSPDTKGQMINKMSGNAITRLTLTKIKSAIISVSSLNEQQEIVRILDNLLENEQQAKELCNVIEKIDLMKKVILARAFRGELGTNNPEEESAVELLKEVLIKKNVETDAHDKGKVKKTKKKDTAEKIIDSKNNGQNDLIRILIDQEELITPERLFELSYICDRYEFYSELKVVIESGKVREIKDTNTSVSLLEVVK